MATVFSFGDTTMYVSASIKGGGLEASARPVAPVGVHLRVYEFRDGGLSLACAPEFTDFRVYPGQLVDPRAPNSTIPDILSSTRYDDPNTRWFWEEKLKEYAFNVGLSAFNAGVCELELNVAIHIRCMARRLLREAEVARWLRGLEAAERALNLLEMDIRMALRLRETEEEVAELLGCIAEEGIGGNFGGVPGSEASVRELEVVRYNGVGGEVGANGCSICLEEFELEMEMT